MAGCPDPDTFAALIAGALAEDVRAQIANHAATCANCFPIVDGLVVTPAESGAPLELRKGTHVGRYVVESRLGAGGMGVVYAAMDSQLHRRVALKVLRPDRQGDLTTHGRERLMREARSLARLSHPNVVTVFDVGVHEGHVFVAMELVDGGSLPAWLARKPPRNEVIDRLLEAGRGLAAAHAAGVVHRDVKPDNILVGSDDRARVTDFGLAHFGDAAPETKAATDEDFAAPITKTGALMGTPAYMAPEQLQGQTSELADQWSLSATYYEAVAGTRPFPIDDLATRLAAITDGRATHANRVPGWLRPILLRGLRASPKARWPDVKTLVRAIERRRNRTRTIAIAAAVAVTLGSGITALAMRGNGAASSTPPAASKPEHDGRGSGCNCPYSWCTGDHCSSVCTGLAYEIAGKVRGVNLEGRQEALVGATSDGNTLLYLAGDACDMDHLWIAHRVGDTFQPIDLTPQLDLSKLFLYESCCTMSADGKTVLISTADRTSFLTFQLENDRLTMGPTIGAVIPEPVGKRFASFPVLSPDQLTLYYRITDIIDERGEVGPAEGAHTITRKSTADAFAEPHQVVGRARSYEYVTAVTRDNLTLLMSHDFETYFLSRPEPTGIFYPPGAFKPARLPGWRAIPVDDCSKIFITTTPGGCRNEDIAYYVPVQ